MPNPIELVVDVSDLVDIGEPAHTAATVYLPDGPLADPPVVCFAFPGGGYSRRYYALDAQGYEPGGQAAFHTDRGWIFVACDHLGFGDATVPAVDVLDYDNIAVGNLATVQTVLAKLRDGELGDRAVAEPVTLGIGQSMGGCFTLVLQGRHAPFDAIGVLGFSAIHTIVPSRPGTPPAVWPWIARGADLADLKPYNAAALAAAAGPLLDDEESFRATAEATEHPFAWSFHYDDVDPEVVAEDLSAGTDPGKPLPSWRSASTPACGIYMVAPGTVALEAASITSPVLSATGERDVVPDPWMEPKAFKSCPDITVYVCPRMGHMHNFASTRQQLWQRIHAWGSGVAEAARASDRRR